MFSSRRRAILYFLFYNQSLISSKTLLYYKNFSLSQFKNWQYNTWFNNNDSGEQLDRQEARDLLP